MTPPSASTGKVKTTKTRRGRTFHVDSETIAMLQRHCERMDERARAGRVELEADPYLFSLVADCSKPMPPDYFTKQVGVLKGYLGIEVKRPEVVASRMRRFVCARSHLTPPCRPDRSITRRWHVIPRHRPTAGPQRTMGESRRRMPQNAEHARASGRDDLDFDGSILALRKFTSSELLDAGFNVSMVAQRQGHGPQVLTRHYSKIASFIRQTCGRTPWSHRPRRYLVTPKRRGARQLMRSRRRCRKDTQ